MKKLIAVILAAILALCLAGCSEKLSDDPLVAKWVIRAEDGSWQVYFSFESIGDLEVVVWRQDETGKLVQTEDHIGTYKADKDNGMIEYLLDGEKYTFGYSVEDKVAITLTFDDTTLVVPYVETNPVD